MMPPGKKSWVFDAWSIMAFFEDEPAGQKVERIIADAQENQIPMMMSIINAGEIWYILAREISESEADSSMTELKHLGIEFIDADWNLTAEAARFKSKNRMSYADCFAAALAKVKKADLITGDEEFKQIENQIKIHWV